MTPQSKASQTPHRFVEVSCENLDCKNPQAMSFTPSEFEEWIEDGEFECNGCREEMSVSGVTLECYICCAVIDFLSLSQIPAMLEERCPECAGREEWDADFYSIVVAGSWSAHYGVYDWTAHGKRMDVLERKGRSDYWEGLVHFCNAEEFIAIYDERRIRASATGLYGRRNPTEARAVCLTEATMPNWRELKERHGEYGFVFRKRDIIAVSGAPAIYLPQPVLDVIARRGERIPKTLWPYLNKLTIPSITPGRRHDFLHEREWRVPQDIDLNVVQPYAVTFPRRRPGIDREELILEAAREFQELSKPLAGPRSRR